MAAAAAATSAQSATTTAAEAATRMKEARKAYENRVTAPPPPPRRTARDILNERKHIDEHMSLLDAAKAKAAAQRAEYGKFLTWKVTMQRKEREEREREDEQLRERVQAKLQEMLEAHRTKKREELSKYRHLASPENQRVDDSDTFSGSPHKVAGASKSRSPRKARSAPVHKLSDYEREELEFEQQLKAQRAENRRLVHERLRESQLQKRRKMTSRASRSAAPGSAGLSAQAFDPSGVAVERLFHSIRAATEQGDGNQLPPAQRLEIGAFEPTAPKDAPTPAQQLRLDRVHTNRKKTDTRTSVVANMFQFARNRRLYATGKMLADPPADFLIGQDLLRYVPAAVMDAVSPRKQQPAAAAADDGSAAFFLTAVGGGAAPLTDLSDVGEERDRGGGEPLGGGSPREVGDPVRSRRARAVRPFDRDAWMRLPSHPSTSITSVRVPAEEQATLDWYYRFYEPLTGIKKRTEVNVPPHQWVRKEKHALPPKASHLFDAS